MEEIFLYLIQAPNTFKIGYSKDPKRRFEQYKTHNSELELIGYLKILDKREEKIIQTNLLRHGYKKFPSRNEWFFGNLEFERLKEFVDAENKYWSQFKR